jgi:hypothetical protein
MGDNNLLNNIAFMQKNWPNCLGLRQPPSCFQGSKAEPRELLGFDIRFWDDTNCCY